MNMRGFILQNGALHSEMGQKVRCRRALSGFWWCLCHSDTSFPTLVLWSSFCHFLSFVFLPLPTFTGHIVLFSCHASLIYKAAQSQSVKSKNLSWTHFLSPLFHTPPVCQKYFPPPSSYHSFLAGKGLLDSWKHWGINNNAELLSVIFVF